MDRVHADVSGNIGRRTAGFDRLPQCWPGAVGAPLYWLTPWPNEMAYYYSPPFALLHAWLTALPFRGLALLALVVQVGSYCAAWWVWRRVLRDLGLNAAAAAVVAWFPAGILYTQWFVHTFFFRRGNSPIQVRLDLRPVARRNFAHPTGRGMYATIAPTVFLNVTGLLCLLIALLTWAIVRERANWAVLVALPIALLKPQWLFPLILLIAFRRWQLLARVLGGLLAAYLLVGALYVAVVGPEYGLASFRDYAVFLTRIDANFPWEGSIPPLTSLNHSLQQILLHAGLGQIVPVVVPAFKLAFLGVLASAVLLTWRRRLTIAQAPEVAILLLWAGYLAVFALIGQLWGLDAGMFAFVMLWSLSRSSVRRVLLVFLGYAFWEVWSLLSYASGGDGLWVSQHVPITFFALILLYSAAMIALYGRLLRSETTIQLPPAVSN